MTVRLSMRALTGISRTVVAVGMDSEESMLAAIACDIPRRRIHSSSLGSSSASSFARSSRAAIEGSEVIATGDSSARRTLGFGGFVEFAVVAAGSDLADFFDSAAAGFAAFLGCADFAGAVVCDAAGFWVASELLAASKRAKISAHFSSTEDLSALYFS